MSDRKETGETCKMQFYLSYILIALVENLVEVEEILHLDCKAECAV